MDVYAHPTFDMAARQFDLVAEHLEIPAADRDRLKYPKRALTVAVLRATRYLDPVKTANLFGGIARLIGPLTR